METTTNVESEKSENRPVDKVRFGRIQASIWENASEKGPYYTVSFERRYQDPEGNWRSSQSFNADDLLLLAKAADKAHDAIFALKRDAQS